MSSKEKPERGNCAYCGSKGCEVNTGFPANCITNSFSEKDREMLLEEYTRDEIATQIMKTAAEVEAEGYCKQTRIEETISFIHKMKFQRIGIAGCVSLLKEMQVFSKILMHHNIDHRMVGCKVGAIDKTEAGISQQCKLRPNEFEPMCNPILQAKYLENEKTDFNIVFGLCIGHDTLFYKYSKAPCTTLVVKDRVLCHNPIAPLHYTNGIYQKLLK